ncbi:MAG: alcohol dehydrogenase catalytic domain-containing protein [Pilosibacter sp.]
MLDEVGSNVKNLKVGDRVIVNQVTSCGHCYPCKIGRGNVWRQSEGPRCSISTADIVNILLFRNLTATFFRILFPIRMLL